MIPSEQAVPENIPWVESEKALSAAEFLALYDRYFPRIYTYFRYRCDDPQTCDDLTALTFEQALAHLDEFQPQKGAFAAWLFGIARNNANLHFRRSRRFRWLPFDFFTAVPASDPPPEDQVIAADHQHLLVSLVARLEPRQRDLLALKFSGGLTNRQIAGLTGLSEQNVGVILHRAIQRLKKQMQQAEDLHE
jgi:RNA polymerase sigma-70 factor (ECF subfamily)